jgi:hypothetical protein
MASFYRFRQFSYKRVFVLLAASLAAFAAMGQEAETANPSAISPSQLRELLAGPAWSIAAPGLLASTDSASAGQPSYEPRADTPGPAAATAPDSLKTAAPASTEAYRNAVRLDVGGIIGSNVASTALGNSGALLPLLVAYERQLSPRFSVVGEGLLNGGDSWERKAGLSVQSRYYFVQSRRRSPLAGFYVAPVLAFRSVRMGAPFSDEVSRRYLGTGVLLGGQAAFRRSQRWFIDVAAGIMSRWQAGPDKTRSGRYATVSSSLESYYDTHPTDFDGRLGVGYRF